MRRGADRAGHGAHRLALLGLAVSAMLAVSAVFVATAAARPGAPASAPASTPSSAPASTASSAPATPAPPFGITLGLKPDAVTAAFAPVGRAEAGEWSELRTGRVLRRLWRCPAERGCLAVPMAADFSFVDDRLAAVALRIDADHAAPDTDVPALLRTVHAAAGLLEPVAQATSDDARRRRLYYRPRPGEHAVAVEDGAVQELKLYLDRLHPGGFAEAVAAGARPVGLEKLPGGKAWAAAQHALDHGRSGDVMAILDDVYTSRGVSPLLVAEAQLVQALALASRAQQRAVVQPEAARADLARARTLAPDLGAELDGLAVRLGLAPIAPTPTPTP